SALTRVAVGESVMASGGTAGTDLADGEHAGEEQVGGGLAAGRGTDREALPAGRQLGRRVFGKFGVDGNGHDEMSARLGGLGALRGPVPFLAEDAIGLGQGGA